MNRILRCILTQILFGAICGSVCASVHTLQPVTGDKLEFDIFSPYPALPEIGHMPIRVAVTNKLPAQVSHKVEFVSYSGSVNQDRASLSFSRMINTEAKGRTVTSLSVPQMVTEGYYWNLVCNVNGPQILRNSTSSVSSGFGSSGRYTLLSVPLHTLTWTPLSNYVSSGGRRAASGVVPGKLSGGQIDAAQLPTDWLAYSGVSGLWMTTQEYSVLRDGVRQALLLGVAQGMTLRLFTEDEGLLPPLPPNVVSDEKNSWRYGYGRITLHEWDGKSVETEKAEALWLDQPVRSWEIVANSDAVSRWDLPNKVSEPRLNLLIFLVFVILFGAIVGPVNLFWFAPEGRRARIFWTTPLISALASLLLIVFVILSEGVGGTGVRHLNVLLLPGQNSALVHQEQLCRTGLLLSRDFTLPGDVWMHALETKGVSKRTGGILRIEGENYSGDWFESRSRQGHLLTYVRPQRERVDLMSERGPGGSPVILSSLSVNLDYLLYVDEDGRRWSARNVNTGSRVVLQPADLSDGARELNTSKSTSQQAVQPSRNVRSPRVEVSPPAGFSRVTESTEARAKNTFEEVEAPLQSEEDLTSFLQNRPRVMTEKFNKISDRRGWFYAFSSNAENLALPTLRAIRWSKTTALVLGPVVSEL